MIHPLTGLLAPGQVRTRRARLRARLALARPAPRLAPRRRAPGRASPDGGIEEFPEFREISRSSRATRRVSRSELARHPVLRLIP
jgi:hypothetical protein